MTLFHLIQNFEASDESYDLSVRRIDVQKTKTNLEALIGQLTPDKDVLVMFYSAWCPDCVELYGEGIKVIIDPKDLECLEISQEISRMYPTHDIIFVNVGNRLQWKKIIDQKENHEGIKNPFRQSPYQLASIPTALMYGKGSPQPAQKWEPPQAAKTGEEARKDLYMALSKLYNP